MSKKIIYCPKCADKYKDLTSYLGYKEVEKNETQCPVCKCSNIVEINLSDNDFDIIADICSDYNFVSAMIALKEKDIIEYELKMSQFRSQVSQKEKAKELEAKKPTCPRCGSTDISETTKGFTFVTGFLNSSDIRMYCKNCHHKWKPNSLNEDITRLINKKF